MLPSPASRTSHTSHTSRRLAVAAALVLGAAVVPAVTAGGAAAQDPVPILPDTHFVGMVNGHSVNATLAVVCPGPIGPGSVGHPAAGQSAEVDSVSGPIAPQGFTGSAGREIVATFVTASSATESAVFTSYFAPVAIPTTWLVPCSGSGVMTFAPEPTSPTAVGYSLKVTFEDIAA